METSKNKLRALLETASGLRTRVLHEDAFTEMIQRAGGSRLTDVLDVPSGVENADYLIPSQQGDILLELKQLHGENMRGSLGEFFDRKPKKIRVKYFEQLPGNITRVNADAMTKQDWTAFHREFRPNLWSLITKAARQLRKTETLAIAQGRAIAARGVWVLNSGDTDLTLDLLARLMLVGIAGEWRGDRFRSLDFAICSAWDQYENPQFHLNALPKDMRFPADRSPFDVRPIYRDAESRIAIASAQKVGTAWMHYCAEAYEADVIPALFRSQPVHQLNFRPESPISRGVAHYRDSNKAAFQIEFPST